ncbi:amidohydrolase [soil metagenome]
MSEPAIPACAPADLSPRPPRSALPAHAVDTHFHIFGPATEYPYAAGRSYTPPDASLAQYEHLARRIGFTRAVVVHPSVYGTDTKRTLAILRETRMPMRGVVVIDETVSEHELLRMHNLGVRGARINLLFKAGVGFATARLLADRIRDLGWHLQFLVDVSEIDTLAIEIEALRLPAVFDHFGHVSAGKSIKNTGFQVLLSLVRDGRAWVKLSAPYRITTRQAPPYSDITPFAEALIAANPDRILWGSDWPHPSIAVAMPNDGDLADMAMSWTSDADIRQKFFVTNAERLYGFDPL